MFECDGAALGSRLLGTLGGPVSAATISVAATRSTHMSATSAISIRIRWCSKLAIISSSFLYAGRRATLLLRLLLGLWVSLSTLGQSLTPSPASTNHSEQTVYLGGALLSRLSERVLGNDCSSCSFRSFRLRRPYSQGLRPRLGWQHLRLRRSPLEAPP